MASELSDGSVFEITDYTTASDWERFIANIEEILTEWKLTKQTSNGPTYRELPDNYISSGLWHERHDIVVFGNVSFDLRYQYLVDKDLYKDVSPDKPCKSADSDSPEFHDADDGNEEDYQSIPKQEEKTHDEHELPEKMPQCLSDMIATSNDFASKAHCLVRWYNLRKFIILAPRGDTIVSEDRIKLILSSACIALANIDCHIPIFVRTHNPKNNFYQGVSEHLNIRTMYEMIFYKQCLKQFAYLSELISVFREKAGCNLNDPISATVRLNYCLDFFDLFIDHKDEFTGTEYSDEDDQDELVKMISEKRRTPPKVTAQDMRSYATYEQVKEALNDCLPHPYRTLKFLHVAALWPPVSDKVITDSRVHSDLDPAEAPIWTIRCVTSDNCNLKIVHDTQVVYQLLSGAVNYAYDKLDGSQIFANCDRDELKETCLRLSYESAMRPEVVLSRDPSDNMRKLFALLFFRASELRDDSDALDQIAGQLKKRPCLSEIYRDFRKHKPSIKEFIIRTQISRPFNPRSTPALPQRMFCTVGDEEFRLCGAFSELCN